MYTLEKVITANYVHDNTDYQKNDTPLGLVALVIELTYMGT